MRGFAQVAAGVRGWTLVLLVASGAGFCGALAVLAADVGARAVMQASLRGADEIAVLLFVWAFLLGTAALYARNEDVALTVAVRSLPAAAQPTIALVTALVMAVAAGLLLVETCVLLYAQRAVVSADLGIPDALRFAPMAIAAASITVTSLVEAWGCAAWVLGGTRLGVWEK